MNNWSIPFRFQGMEIELMRLIVFTLFLAAVSFFSLWAPAGHAQSEQKTLVPALGTGGLGVMTDKGAPLSCLFKPFRVSELGSAKPGVIESILVQPGDKVDKGQVVVKLDSEVNKARLKLRKAQASYLRSVVSRNDDLYERGLLPDSKYDKMTAKLRQARLSVALQKKILQTRTIKSPFDGIVVKEYVEPGERVENNKIMKIAQIDPLLVEVVMPVDRYGEISPGMTAEITINTAISAKTLHAEVWRTDKVMDAASGTFTVSLKMNNPDLKIPAGIRCQVQF